MAFHNMILRGDVSARVEFLTISIVALTLSILVVQFT